MIQSSNYVLSVLMEALPADRGRDKSCLVQGVFLCTRFLASG